MISIVTTAPVADVDWGHMGDWGAASWLAMIAFWALIVVLLVWAVREFAGPGRDGPPSATEILERRLATGEIGLEEYRERRAALHREPSSNRG